MYEVTVEAGFSSGHYLRNYKGKCENPHGHNYKVRVTLAGAELDEAGLLLDFKLLKQVLRPVIDRIDHRMLNDLEPFTVLNPSAENIAKYFYDQTNEQLAGMTQRPRARERLHHLGDRHHHGYLLRVARGLLFPAASRGLHDLGNSSPGMGGLPAPALFRISIARTTLAFRVYR
jgi:6-pyruvoyltetrahydropterin/6-carboxytetrahydropterin synthase